MDDMVEAQRLAPHGAAPAIRVRLAAGAAAAHLRRRHSAQGAWMVSGDGWYVLLGGLVQCCCVETPLARPLTLHAE
jgi:hypothetical protein